MNRVVPTAEQLLDVPRPSVMDIRRERRRALDAGDLARAASLTIALIAVSRRAQREAFGG